MTHDHAVEVADKAAIFLSRMLRENRIPASEKEAAGDLAIDLSLVSKAHRNRSFTEKPPMPTTAGSFTS